MPLVKKGVDPLLEWRWGSVVETAHGVESLRVPLEHWDLDKLNFKGSAGDADDVIPGDADYVIPGDAGAGDGDRNNKKKAALDTSLIGEAVTSFFGGVTLAWLCLLKISWSPSEHLQCLVLAIDSMPLPST